MSSPPLLPETVRAAAENRGRVPFAFAPRFFVLLIAGLVWLIPAWWSVRFLPAMFVWDALVMAGWLIDLWRLTAASSIRVERHWLDPLILVRSASVRLCVESEVAGLELLLLEAVAPSLRVAPPRFRLTSRTGDPVCVEYSVLPQSRGAAQVGHVSIRYRSWLALAEKWTVAKLAQRVLVLPDVVGAQNQALFLIRTRQIEMQKRRRRQRGIGREFESLREYRQGDEMRDICWSATARRGQLIARTYEAERSQSVWVMLDAGRLLRSRVRQAESGLTLTKLDYSVNAALSLAQVASQYGDRVGLIAYSRHIQAVLAPGRGAPHLRSFIEALALAEAEPREADHGRAARTLLQKQTRRSLVVWLTDFAETPSTPDIVEFATHVAQRHLVLFAAVSQPDLAALAHKTPETESEMFEVAAALEVVQRRELLLRQLRECGVLARELTPQALNAAVVNEYLEVKDRSLL